ncbi:MAG: flagellar basal-body rod protein FlgF [Pseudomonadota bacterium]|nr:flagellar basal-body rod protein FlgF [Pseudomonadota bacterium]
MFQALFNSLSGLFSFSRSLNTVSNNVSNMNTPGFRGSDSFFANVNGGLGVKIADDGLRTTTGDIRQTSNATDLAIDGEGFFVLRDAEGGLHYTRAGQFRFNEEGLLVDSVNNHEVMGIDGSGNLVSIDFDNHRTIPAQATSRVKFQGNLAPGSTTTTVNTITVFDAAGTAHVLSATFTNNSSVTPGSFTVVVKDETGAVVSTSPSEVRFRTDGTPQAGFNEMTLSLNYGGVPQSVVLNFGTAGGLDGATSLTGTATNLAAKPEDGHGVLGVTSVSFDEKGVMQLVYSQTEKRQGPQIALASFRNEGALEMAGGSLLTSNVDPDAFGRPGDPRFGRIAGGSLEMSNVDLTQEFADMIIIQRGYQASSRVMTVSNEMIEQLYNSTRGG